MQYYYPRTIRTILVALLDAFNDIHVYNFENPISGTTSNADLIKVPIGFGPMDKRHMSRLEGESNQRYYEQLPKIGIAIKNIEYDADRVTGANEYRYFADDNVSLHDVETFFKDVQPTPYNINFDMKIRTNSMDQILQIAEQILPYFNPDLRLSIKEFSFLNINRDVDISLNGFDIEYVEEMTENDRREVNGNISIVAKAVLYKPYTTSSIIKFIDSKYYINQTNSLSGTNSVSGSAYNLLTTSYLTSGFESLSVSAFPNPNQYSTSGFDSVKDIYYFTSATSTNL